MSKASTPRRKTTPPPATPTPEQTRSTRTGQREPIKVTVDSDIANKIRNAFWEVRYTSRGRYRTLSDVIEEALERQYQALADEYNNGKPFPQRPVTNLPAGRPGNDL